jgi:succinoglycan biosynthesis protein ExoW
VAIVGFNRAKEDQVMSRKISVVIPFYQKEEGILTKAVQSALNQTGLSDHQVVIVDDASPVSAREELGPLIRDNPGRIVIIEQLNAGPAAARNKGLDSIEADTEYVAFLDSDDEWIDTHLSNSLFALEQGYDFYFADLYQLNQTVSAFNRAKRIQVDMHPKLDGTAYLREYSGDMFNQILTGNIIGTSTVVYRYRKFPKLRFREEFVYAGEDYLFWLELSRLTTKIAFSSLCECTYGPGVNVFSGSGWGTEKSLIRIHHEMKYKKSLETLFALNRIQADGNKKAVAALRKSFVADVVHRLTHRRTLDRKVLIEQLKVDPQTFFYFIPLAMQLAIRR